MFSSAPKQQLKTEENGFRHCLKPATFLKLSRSYSELGQHGSYLQTCSVRATPASGCRLFLGKEQDLGFQKQFVQSAAILWLLRYSGVEKLFKT